MPSPCSRDEGNINNDEATREHGGKAQSVVPSRRDKPQRITHGWCSRENVCQCPAGRRFENEKRVSKAKHKAKWTSGGPMWEKEGSRSTSKKLVWRHLATRRCAPCSHENNGGEGSTMAVTV